MFLLYWKYIAAFALLAALVLFYNVHVDGLIKTAVTQAEIARDGQWRDAEAKAIEKSKADAALVEAAHKTDLAAIQAKHEKEIADGKAQAARDVAAVRAHTLVLRIPSSCPSPANVSGAASSGNPASQGTALPSGLTERLLGLSNAADDLIDELNTCWQTVASDRQSPKGISP